VLVKRNLNLSDYTRYELKQIKAGILRDKGSKIRNSKLKQFKNSAGEDDSVLSESDKTVNTRVEVAKGSCRK